MRKRVLLKLSGEVLGGKEGKGFDREFIRSLIKNLAHVYAKNVDIAIVIGGGNIFRGALGQSLQIDRAVADQMGMLSTVINGLALRDIFAKENLPCELLSMMPSPHVCDSFSREKGNAALDSRKILICAGGTGGPYFTTDTASVIKAKELGCAFLLKGTKVPGVFSKDPQTFKDAKHIPKVSYKEVLDKKLYVMDRSAFELAQDFQIPIIVFSVFAKNPFSSIFDQSGHFSIISDHENNSFLSGKVQEIYGQKG